MKTHIVFPSCVYGIVKNGFTEAGLQNPISIQVPGLIRAAIDRKQGGMVGLGKNMWPNVHIDDRELPFAFPPLPYYAIFYEDNTDVLTC